MSDRADVFTVLLVEDSADVRTTMRMLIALGCGHEVHEAADGASGVALALAHRPRVALIDVGLPDIDGNEVARRIRAALGPHTIRLIALTGYDTAEDRRRSAEAGFDLHLVKPVDHATLRRLFAEVQAEDAAFSRG